MLPASNDHAFSRLDLLVLVCVLLLLGTWFAFSHFGERARIAQCAYNLKALGQAMQGYADEHHGEIPAAMINLGETRLTWDTPLFPYLKAGSPISKTATGEEARHQQNKAFAHWFFCPSDPIQRIGIPRSYAMSEHGMSLNDWPPRYDSASGPGLFWDDFWTAKVLPPAQVEKVTQNPELLPKMNLSEIPAPADTLLLTEYFHRVNVLQETDYAHVGNVGEQLGVLKEANAGTVHYNRFNYLMVDGHVELLNGFQTGGEAGPGGIWTIQAGD
jgi:prepilin-type processing-associated H-X9-DG protein